MFERRQSTKLSVSCGVQVLNAGRTDLQQSLQACLFYALLQPGQDRLNMSWPLLNVAQTVVDPLRNVLCLLLNTFLQA